MFETYMFFACPSKSNNMVQVPHPVVWRWRSCSSVVWSTSCWPPTCPPSSCSSSPTPPPSSNLSTSRRRWRWTWLWCWSPQHSSSGEGRSRILIFWCSYQMSSSQCDGKASGHFLRSFGGHLAHIRTTHPLCGGNKTFQFITPLIYHCHCITCYRWFSSQLLSFIMRMMPISIIMGSWEMSPSTRPRSQNRRRMWQKWSQMGRWYQTCLL